MAGVSLWRAFRDDGCSRASQEVSVWKSAVRFDEGGVETELRLSH